MSGGYVIMPDEIVNITTNLRESDIEKQILYDEVNPELVNKLIDIYKSGKRIQLPFRMTSKIETGNVSNMVIDPAVTVSEAVNGLTFASEFTGIRIFAIYNTKKVSVTIG